MCFFSVVTTVYNSEKYLYNALESVKNQTCLDYEYIIVDNGSTDRSTKLIEQFKTDNINLNISVIRLEKNQGISGGRNVGIDHAKGKYVCFLDADDYWNSDKLEKVKKNILENNQFNVFCHWENHVKGNEERTVKYRKIDNENPFYDLITKGNCLSTSAMAVERSLLNIIKGFDRELVSGEEDFDCWLRLARNGAKFFMIEESLGYWLIRTDSVSAKHIAHTEAVLEMLKPHFKYMESEIGSRKSRKIKDTIAAKEYCGCARSVSKGGNIKQGNKYFIKALKIRPLYIKAYIGLVLNIIHR